MRYDSDVQEIVTRMFFNGFAFENEEMDRWFKRAFINRYHHRQIDFQTVEVFASHILSHTLMIERELMFLYEHYEKMLRGQSDTRTSQDSERTSESRDANSSLPQDQLNLNFDTMEMRTADDHQIHKSKDGSRSDSTTETSHFDANTFKQMQHTFEYYLNSYEPYFYQL